MKKLLTLAVAVLVSAAVSAFASSDADFAQSLTLDKAAAQTTQIGRYDSDCATVSLGANETSSQYVTLRSQEWIQECRWVPDYCPPRGGGGGDPRRGGGNGGWNGGGGGFCGGHQECWNRPGGSWSESARVRVNERKPLYPWERDSFRVCLEGPWLSARALSSAYNYRQGSHSGSEFVFVPGERTPMKPDAAGIVVAAWTPGLKLTLKDRWASYYAADRTNLKIKLKEDKSWSDPTLVEFTAVFPAGQESAVIELVPLVPAGKLKAGKKYYAKIEFQRVGAVSTADTVSAGETTRAVYAPAATGFASNE